MYKILNCLKCSKELKEGAKICGNCGEPVPKGMDFDKKARPAKTTKKKPKKYVVRDPRSLQRSKMPGKTKLAIFLFVFMPIGGLLYFANHFYQSSLVQDDQTRILLLKQHLTKLNENEHRARLEIYKRLMDLDGGNKEYLVKYDFHRSQIEAQQPKEKRKKKKPRPSTRGFGNLAQEIEGAKDAFGCETTAQYLKVERQGTERTRFKCPYAENRTVVWYVNEAKNNGKTESSQLIWSGQEVNHPKQGGVIQPRPDVEDALSVFANHYAPENVITLEQAFKDTNKGRVLSRHYIFNYDLRMSESKKFARSITVVPR